MEIRDMDKIQGMLKESFVDDKRANALRTVITYAYTTGNKKDISDAVKLAQEYVDDGGDFPLSFWQYDDTIEDYDGKDADMMAEKYLVRLLRDSYCDYDEDQDYIATGLKPSMRYQQPIQLSFNF